jgi:tight adherence protein B
VTAAAFLAGLSGALAVVGAWDALAAVEQAVVARAFGRWAAPLRAARWEGRSPTVVERRRLGLVGAGALLAGGWMVAGPVVGAACAAAGPLGVGRLVRVRRERWRADLARGAPAAARALADALAGGHAVRGALGVAAEGGVPGAAGRELASAARALALGARTEDVLERLRARARDPAWDTIVAAILLQREAGGDLAGLLRSIATRLEDAVRVEAEARSATAQARFTAWLVALLPTGAGVLAELAHPGYVGAMLRAPLAAFMLGTAATLQLVACVAIRRIARMGDARVKRPPRSDGTGR